VNNVNIVGRIGKDIELRYLQSGSAVASFSIAVDQSYKKDGQKVEKTSWFDVSAFGKTAELVNQYFYKGSMIGITGELEQQTWQAQDGSNRSKVIIKMQQVTFIDKKSDNQSNNAQANQGYQQPQQPQPQQYQPPAQANQGYQQPQQPQPQQYQPPAQSSNGEANQGYQQPAQQYQAPHGQVPVYNEPAPQQANQQSGYQQPQGR